MKAKQEDVVKERERQIVTSKTSEAHLTVEASVKAKHVPAKQVVNMINIISIKVF